MAQFTEKRTPYELLFRWSNDGILQGAHIAFLDTVLKDGEILNQSQSPAQAVAIGEQAGFPLADILNQVQIDLIKNNEALVFEKEEIASELQIVKDSLAGVIAERDALSGIAAKSEKS